MNIRHAAAFLFSCLLMPLSPSAVAEGIERLKAYTENLKTLQADFKQTLFDEKMRQLEVSTGEVYLKKPGRFRWDYEKPYRQRIIADGEKLWIYDPELDQVMVKPLSEALGTAPIALLTGGEPLHEQFKIIELGTIEGRQYVQLEAKVKDTDFGFMLLAFGGEGLEAMELKDKLGQVTRIELIDPVINQPIKDEVFEFTPPEGVDIIGE